MPNTWTIFKGQVLEWVSWDGASVPCSRCYLSCPLCSFWSTTGAWNKETPSPVPYTAPQPEVHSADFVSHVDQEAQIDESTWALLPLGPTATWLSLTASLLPAAKNWELCSDFPRELSAESCAVNDCLCYNTLPLSMRVSLPTVSTRTIMCCALGSMAGKWLRIGPQCSFKYWSDTLVVKSAALWTHSFIINLSYIWTVSSRLGELEGLERRLELCIKYVTMSSSLIL